MSLSANSLQFRGELPSSGTVDTHFGNCWKLWTPTLGSGNCGHPPWIIPRGGIVDGIFGDPVEIVDTHSELHLEAIVDTRVGLCLWRRFADSRHKRKMADPGVDRCPGGGLRLDFLYDFDGGIVGDVDPESSFLKHGDHAGIVGGRLGDDSLQIPFPRDLEAVIG